MTQVRDTLVQHFLVKSSFLETIKSLDGKVYNIAYHQKRYVSVLNFLGTTEYKNLLDFINPPSQGLYRCRVVYTKDTLSTTYHPYTKRDIKSLKLVEDNKIEYKYKSTKRSELDRLFELKEECDDILIVKNSLITDTSIANIAFYKEGKWFTPKEPLLKGTTRQRLLDAGQLIEKDIAASDIYSYERVALLNAMIDFDIIRETNIRKILC